MTWLVEEQPEQKQLAELFRQLIKDETILQLPGTYDGMTARIAKEVGFSALYLSGAAYTASRSLPDLGLIHSQEVAERARELNRATSLPILVDIDTGYGGALQVARAAKEMVEARVAAVQIEDQVMPKKCGHLGGKELVPIEEMQAKVKIIKEVAPSLIVVARSDAKEVEGIKKMVERANAYLSAGADLFFPEALESEEEFRYVRQKVNAPLLANMTEFGKTPYFTSKQFQDWGYQVVIYPVTALRVAAKACQAVFQEILTNGTQQSALPVMQTRHELYQTIRYHNYEQIESIQGDQEMEDKSS
ncbi:methylisocitrate lyase [Seinonella peptonophila]|uniref:Methylisocitrate lyase n=1 Tax=Seinonella peptonophila TaxID=112248 RepID=A0A1M4TD07_9BACL|nr:methylisocitrate lyase [Seinonella peptonophila]SHE42323.1 methylisocitrate lyase [Seinonella peptonophila]